MKTRVKLNFCGNLILSVVLFGSFSLTVPCRTRKFKTPTTVTQLPNASSDREATYAQNPVGKPKPGKKPLESAPASASPAAPLSAYEVSNRIDGLENVFGVKIPFSEKQELVDKFMEEADRSPYYWTALIDYISKAKIEVEKATAIDEGLKQQALILPNASGKSSSPDPTQKATAESMSQARDTAKPIRLIGFLAQPWGDVILSSEPSRAEVWLDDKRKEGETEIKRRYPEGIYTFTLTKSGYKPVTITVTVTKDRPVQQTVVLNNQ